MSLKLILMATFYKIDTKKYNFYKIDAKFDGSMQKLAAQLLPLKFYIVNSHIICWQSAGLLISVTSIQILAIKDTYSQQFMKLSIKSSSWSDIFPLLILGLNNSSISACNSCHTYLNLRLQQQKNSKCLHQVISIQSRSRRKPIT